MKDSAGHVHGLQRIPTPWRWALVLGLLLLGAAGLLVAFLGRETLLMWFQEGRGMWLEWEASGAALRLPWLLIYLAAFALLPAIGVPLSPFYLTVATFVGSWYGGLLAAGVCLFTDLVLSYWLLHGLGRPFAARVAAWRGVTIPQVSTRNAGRLTVAVRLSPAPFLLQNVIIVLGGVSFRTYLLWSFVCQGLIGGLVVVAGDWLLSGNAKLGLFGLLALVSIAIGLSWWRRRHPKAQLDGLGA